MSHLEIMPQHLMWLKSPLAGAVGWTLFHSLWEGAIVALALGAMLAMTRSARARYLAAALGMCAILLCLGVTLLRLAPGHPTPGAIRSSIALGWNDRVNVADIPQPPMRRVADFLPWLVPFWMAGVAFFCLRHLASWALTLRLGRTGVCSAPDFWLEELSELRRRVGLSRPVGLLESCLAAVPVVMGHVRPVILMPVGLLTGLPAQQIESILLHELAHIRRCDYLVNMLQTSVESLLFYHPVVWWISGVIRTEREHCCDDLAVSLSGDVHEYAVALAALEQFRWGSPETALAATGGNLVKRIRRLLVPQEGPSSALTPFVSVGILMIAAAVGLTAWQAKTPDSAALPAPRVEGAPVTRSQWQQMDRALEKLAELRQDFDRAQAGATAAGPSPEAPQFERALQTITELQEDFTQAQAGAAAAGPSPEAPQFERALQRIAELRQDFAQAQAGAAAAGASPYTLQIERALETIAELQQDFAQAQAAAPAAGASPYTKWLDEDVVYIILPEERTAFLALDTDDERAEFIKQFWLRRDPTPGTAENEFKDEHYRRIAYANLHFPTVSGKAGWKTDLGRIYIRFGPPDEIDDHSSGDTRAAVPYIDWTYRFIESRDINGTNVKVEFVDPTGSHDFKMTLDPNPPAAK
jgi:GWxTD domain-containing protein